ncbi:hypothetical protein Q5425_30705 [Amycolatopsis sp. A133]|uniref:hypothetical protein n=1 Tax=Amycolatopsis sp. A133 TaxID=3064472 RepID=UPI0027EF555E|nr:hypothetical protein [Amycolatopsis sp. A133]MDQ7808126.1 hypothetical protein [Amycolatopsis sp. A133]
MAWLGAPRRHGRIGLKTKPSKPSTALQLTPSAPQARTAKLATPGQPPATVPQPTM